MENENVELSLVLTTDQAMALAQYCKRIGFSDVRIKATNNDDAYEMLYGLNQLAKELAEAGFKPR